MKFMKIVTIQYVIPLIIIPIYFNRLIPSPFELSGFIFVIPEKLAISYFYLPILGLFLSIICMKIYSEKLFENSIIFNKIILISIFSIITIKLGIPPMKIFFYPNYYKNIEIINIINNMEFSLLKICLISLGLGIYLFIKRELQILRY